MQKSNVKFYCFVVQTLLNMFRALLCPSSEARQTAFAASGFRIPKTCWAVSVQQSNKILPLIVASSWVFYLNWGMYESEITNGEAMVKSNLKIKCLRLQLLRIVF